MKTINKGLLQYLRMLYYKDLESTSQNNDKDSAKVLDDIIDDTKELTMDDDVLFTLRPKKHYSNKSKFDIKPKRRFVPELTKWEIDTICGTLNIHRDGMGDYDMPEWRKLTKLWAKIDGVRSNPIKTIKN